jgi:eukaryotic-like serine/threonine-protein kinase
MAELTGQSFGRYHILEQLGEGGMATVYKAYDTRLERDVAIKVIRVDQFAPAVLERVLKRFEREAKSLARMTHPNVVHVNDYGEQDGIPYLVMDYLSGGTLKQQLGKPMSWQEAVRILLPIAQALEYAHEHGILHRDVKPSNILLTDKSQPMLTDFGIAKILESEDAQTLTGTGIGVGTPEYMAPEQWTGHTTTQSDIYSLGVVLYELITGRKPYTADTPAAVLLKQATEPLPRPTQYVAGLPEQIEKVLLKTLARKPDDRYLTMAAFATAMEGMLSGVAQIPAVSIAAQKMGSQQVEPDTEATTDQMDVPVAVTVKKEDRVPQVSSRTTASGSSTTEPRLKLALKNRVWLVVAGVIGIALVLGFIGTVLMGISMYRLGKKRMEPLATMVTRTQVPTLISTLTLFPPTATHVDTPAPASTLEPTPFSSGSINIPQTFIVDLDQGVLVDSNHVDKGDIWFEAATSAERYLTLWNGMQIALVGTHAPELSGCQSASYSSNPIAISDLPEGTYVCVQTNEGRYSQVRIEATVGPSPGTLSISYTTW